jgi:hypothetical protein
MNFWCKANEIRYKHNLNHIDMFIEACKKGKVITRKTPRTTWYCILFSDSSRLGFRKHGEDFNLISWFYYI